MFAVCVQTLLGVQLRAVAGQIELFDPIFALGQLGFHRLGVVRKQVIQDQKHLATCVLDQTLQKLDQPFRFERLLDDHPARPALIRHRGNHRQPFACAFHDGHDRSLALGGLAAPAHRDTPVRFCPPVNLATFGLGLGFNRGALVLEPSLYGFRLLLVGPVHGGSRERASTSNPSPVFF